MKKKKLLISGGAGRLAKRIAHYAHELGFIIEAPTRAEMDITDPEQIRSMLVKFRPDIFLHAAAFTRPMSAHQESPSKSIQTNITGTSNVVIECMSYSVKLVYISTDYVYPGLDGSYSESSPVLPYGNAEDGISKYGWSKLGGECAVRLYDNSLILRVCMCNEPFPHEVALADVKKSYIFEDEAAYIILRLLNEQGVINVGGEPRTVYEFAKEGLPSIEKITSSEISGMSIAPDTSMDVSKMKMLLSRHNAGEGEHAKKC